MTHCESAFLAFIWLVQEVQSSTRCCFCSSKARRCFLFVFDFLGALLRSLPPLLAPFALAWIVSTAILVLGFSGVKNRVRNHITQLDNTIRAWAATLRYKIAGNEAVERDETTERIVLSWFFRFWTNFASAPSLSFLSLAIPFLFWMNIRGGQVSAEEKVAWLHFLLPGLCYAGSMLMSFVLKRVFKRVRPPRKGFAFGHKLKDPSFPSGHSLTAFCFWMMCVATVIRWSGWSSIAIILFTFVAIAIVALTGLSRVYLGVHFPSDVLGGYFIGLVWCVACYVALSPRLWEL